MDLSNYKGRVQVNTEEYDKFILWYMKKCNIRVLKIKDMVSSRTVIDKKTKELVAVIYSRGMDVGYMIYDKFYKEYTESIKNNENQENLKIKEYKCKSNECEGHEGVCCMKCSDIMTCTAPCESADYEKFECGENSLLIVE